MRLQHLLVLGAMCGTVGMTGCGSKKSTDAATTPAGGSAAGIAADSEQSTSVVSAQMDEAATALSAGDSSSNAAAASLAMEGSEGRRGRLLLASTITRTRTCATDSGGQGALVTLTYSGSGAQTVGKATVTETAAGGETRDWTNANNKVVCTANAQYAQIAWTSAAAVGTASGFNGLSLADTTTRQRTLATSFTRKDGSVKTRSAAYTEKGTRNVTWSGTTPTSTTKSIYLDVTKTFTLTKFDGTTIDLSGEHTVAQATPLSVTTTRDATGKPTAHVINSGTMAINKTGSFYVTNTFKGLTFDLTASDPCTPTTGTITTNIYKSNAAADTATATATLTFDFSTSPPTVTGGDATASDNMVGSIDHKCDFKDPE